MVGTEKVFYFLFYHALRNHDDCGGKSCTQEHGFSCANYNTVTTKWASYQGRFEHGEISNIPDPEKPLQADTINTYKSILYNQWLDQVSKVGNIENAFCDHGETIRESVSSLRNQYIFLQCYSGLLCSESMFLGELSDMLGMKYQRSRNSDPFFILVMQIAAGKFCWCLSLPAPLILTVDCCFLLSSGKTVKL
jgi:hypothetical protein